MIKTRIRSAFLAGARGLALMVLSLTASVALFSFTLVSLALIPVGVGLLTTPVVLTVLRGYAGRRRLLAGAWSGVRVPTPYRPVPADPRGGLAGRVERCVLLLKDPATWRDLLWLPVDMTAGCVIAVLPAALFLYPVESLVLVAGLWRLFTTDGAYWYGFVPVHSQATALLTLPLALAVFAGALRFNPALLRAHSTLTGSLLGPTHEMELARRVDQLTETRHDAVDASAAELRRIERDLHDGAQARLVAMGMNLGTIEALVEKDPAQAKKLLAMARASSAEALTELRDLVRGIHPPVLAERGLGDAVRALALRLPVETEVTVDLPGRAGAPVESAAYFAVSEVLTNAVKHARADRVLVDLHHADGMLRVCVTDDGQGGAAAGKGSGLSGVERRLGTFDGVLAVSSPAGGPTMVTMEIPCALS
ncbi:sensor histidine kinase [Streptomyces albidochromogenes]|uniref:histidine kinase n=1 Tax=Streptomyces albidochromogenes TaxID=329524 RepID=A0ABW6FW26_9ACTN